MIAASRIECSENEKQHEIRIFINSIDISALYFWQVNKRDPPHALSPTRAERMTTLKEKPDN